MLRNGMNDQVYQMPKSALADIKEALENIPVAQVAAMRDEINHWADAVDEDRSDSFDTSWETVKDWKKFKNGVFEPLFEACDEMGVAYPIEYAGLMLGWLIRQEIVNRADQWLFNKSPELHGNLEEGQHMRGTFYQKMNPESHGREPIRTAECAAP